ncbi:MAG: ABC transporter ATP-binding protein [Sphaerochaetaceae bacterium]
MYVEIDNLSKEFPGVKALQDVNLTIKEGEFFTLLGPSGCGKTTLLRIIAGFYRQNNGHIKVAGELIDHVPPHLRDIGMVFQNYAVFPHMTVEKNVAFGLENRKIPKHAINERVGEVLEMVQMSGYEKRTPDKLSGGQQQRVGLARALVIAPRLLLMDEPLSNLDAKLRLNMREEILDIQRRLGTTAIYVTHDQEEALVISDRIAVMDLGVVQQVGTPWEIYRDPVNEFVSSFVGSMNKLGGEEALRSSKSVKELSSTLPWGIKAEECKVCFRPTDAEIWAGGEQKREDSVYFVGKVSKALFVGSGVIYRIQVGDDLILTVHSEVADPEEIIEEGGVVEFYVEKKRLLFFDKATGVRLRQTKGV